MSLFLLFAAYMNPILHVVTSSVRQRLHRC